MASLDRRNLQHHWSGELLCVIGPEAYLTLHWSEGIHCAIGPQTKLFVIGADF
jgi:hypothetical protein